MLVASPATTHEPSEPWWLNPRGGAMQFSVEHELETTGDASPKVGPIAGRGAAVVDPELHRTLLDVLRAVASHRDLPTLLRELFDVLQRVVPFVRVTLVLHDPGPTSCDCIRSPASGLPARPAGR